MLKSEFWKLIDDTRQEADGDAKAHRAAFESALDDLELYELVSFGHWFDDYFATAHACSLHDAATLIGAGGDGFPDFKAWLILRGEKTFEAAVANPESLAKVVGVGETCRAPGFHLAAQALWARKAEKPVEAFPRSPLDAGEQALRGEQCGAGELGKRYPKLSKKFASGAPAQARGSKPL